MSAENNKLFMERLALILKDEQIDILTTGVVVSAEIIDETSLINYLGKKISSISIDSVTPYEVSFSYEYETVTYFTTREDASYYKEHNSCYRQGSYIPSSEKKQEGYNYIVVKKKHSSLRLNISDCEQFLNLTRI